MHEKSLDFDIEIKMYVHCGNLHENKGELYVSMKRA
jgi:hypothetical protein